MTTTRICHPMSPFKVKLTDTCAEGATDKGIFRPTKLTTQSISERNKCLIVSLTSPPGNIVDGLIRLMT